MKCWLCDSVHVGKYFELRNSPGLQNVLYPSEELARKARTFSADFWICADCLFLFNPGFQHQEYSAEYNNDQSFSEVYRTHLVQVAQILKKYVAPNDRIVEIGCGNGLILSLLAQDGYHGVEGYDPAHAAGLGFVRKEYWRPSGKLCDALILRHTLEGLVNFRDLLAAAIAEMRHDGILYLELRNSRFIVENAHTLALYHESAQYFSETSIGILLGQLGLYLHEIQHFFSGEVLSVVARHKKIQPPRKPRIDKLNGFRNVYIWGISGRTVHFLTGYELNSRTIAFGVDIDPKKQGKYIPITGQKIVTPEECIENHPDAVIVLNECYVEEVARLFPYRVTILTQRDFYDE